jgi:sugar phosphate isomerase/epimerase
MSLNLSVTISSLGSKFAPIIFQGDYTTGIKKAKEIGFKAVELHIRDPKAINTKEIIEALEKNIISVSTIGTGQAYVDEGLHFTSVDKNIRDAAVKRIKEQVELAERLRAKVIIGTIKGLLPEDNGEQEIALERVIRCLRDCSEYAQKKDVPLVLEAINRYESNYLNTAEQTIEFIKKVGSPVIGLHLDTFHMNIEEKSIVETIKKYSYHLSHLHFADSNRWAPGFGHIDFAKIVAVLKKINYEGYIGIEALPLPDDVSAAKQALFHIGKLV